MKKRLLLFFALLAVVATVVAKPVDQATARKVATAYLQSVTGKSYTSLTDITAQTPFHEFYVFTLSSDKGFVLVSADDCVMPVLGYSENTPFVVEDMPPHIMEWLQMYDNQIIFYRDRVGRMDYGGSPELERMWQNLSNGAAPGNPLPTAVSPMLTTTWNQSPYYNNLCPQDASGARSVTGCAATACAQIMKKWNHPATGYSSHGYTHDDFGYLSANYGNTTYNWSNMPNALNSSSSTTQVNAVATLMYHIGVAINMDYSPSGSGGATASWGNANTPSVENALVYYFKYKPTCHTIFYGEISDDEWHSTLRAELDAGRPVLYTGYDTSAGHAFVFDGYNNQGQYHVNWGWGGSNDGYYAVGQLSPGAGGTGGNATYTFNLDNYALIGIEPNTNWSSSATTSVTLSVSNSNAGSVTGSGTYNFGDSITIGATATQGNRFFKWSDGSTLCNREMWATGGSLNLTAVVEPLSGDTLDYCFATEYQAWGYGDFTTDNYWGIVLPAATVANHDSLTKVLMFANEPGTYELIVYTGSSPSNVVYSHSYTINEEGWNDMELTTPVAITGTQNIWIFIKNNGIAYPIALSKGCGNNHGSLYSLGNPPTQGIYSLGTNYACMIKAVFGRHTESGDGNGSSGCRTVTIGDEESNSSSYFIPVNTYYNYSLTETIIDASEIGGPMTINSLSYYYDYSSAVTSKTNCTIYVQQTTKTAFLDASDIEQLSLNAVMVYSGSLNCTQGWNEFTFTTPFEYDGTSNLMVIIDDNSGDYDGGSYKFRTSSCSGIKTVTWYSDDSNPDLANTSLFSGNTNYLTSRVLMRLTGCPSCSPAEVEIGDVESTTSENKVPYNTFYNFSLTESIIDQDEIGGAMDISGISYKYAHTTATNPSNCHLRIWIKPTTKTTFASSTDIELVDGNATLVYDGTPTFTQGWNDITFTNPYSYNGSGNIVVIVNDSADGYDGNAFKFNTSTCTGEKTLVWYSDSQCPDPTSNSYSGSMFSYSYRPVMKLQGCSYSGVTCPAPRVKSIVYNDYSDLGKSATVVWDTASLTDPEYEIRWTQNHGNNVTIVNFGHYGSHNFLAVYDDTSYIAVRAICSPGDTSEWSQDYLIYAPSPSYCQPAPTSVDGQGITNVYFGIGNEVVNNSQGPTSSPYYGDYSNLTGAVPAGVECTVEITYATGYSYGTIIWVDWNQNMTFDGNEVVYVGESSSDSPITLNALFTIPANQPVGNYRMRIAGADSYYDTYIGSIAAAADANPCPNTPWTIVHDYTLHVTEAPSCMPVSGVTVSSIGSTTATVTFTTSGAPSYDVYAYTATNYIACSTSTTTGTATLTGLTPATDYYIRVQASCGNDVYSILTTPVHIVTALCEANQQCPITVVMNDGYGDGWNGGELSVIDSLTGSIVATLAAVNHGQSNVETSDTVQLALCGSRDYYISYSSGNYDDEVSFVFYANNGDTILNVSYPAAGFQGDFSHDCSGSSGCVAMNPLIGDTTSTTTSYYTPVNNYYKYTLTETIIDAAEIGGPMTINSISYYFNYSTASTSKTDVTIYLQPTSKSVFASSSDIDLLDPSSAVMVYTGDLNCSQGWNTFTFTTPYYYDGEDNLMVIVDDNSNAYNSNSHTFRTTACTGYKTIYWYSDSQNPDPSSSSFSGSKGYLQSRVVMKFDGCQAPGVTCPKPATIAETHDINDATVTWTGDALNYSVTLMNASGVIGYTTVSASATAAPSYTFANLMPNTEYTVQIRSHCSTSDSSTAKSITFRTYCAAITAADLPYSEDFESYSTGSSASISPCWTKGTNHTSTQYPYPNTSVVSGAISLYFYGYKPTSTSSSSIYSYAALPQLATSVDVTDLTLSFKAKRYSSTSATYRSIIYVGVMTDPDDVSTFTNVHTIDMTPLAASTIQQYNVDLSSYTGSGKYVAFYCPPIDTSAGYSYNYIYVDDVVLDVTPTCSPVADLTASNPTASSVVLSWADASNTSATYAIYDMSDTSLLASAVSGNTYTVTGLTQNTQYSFGVRAVCSATDYSPIMTVAARTACGAETLPFTEDFSANLSSNLCWRGASNATAAQVFAGTSLTLTTPSWTYASATRDGLPAGHYYKNVYGTSVKSWLITPAIDLTNVTSAQLSFDVALTDYNNAALPDVNGDTNNSQAFMVIVSTDGGNTWSQSNATIWQNVGGDYTYASLASTSYQNKVINLNQYVGNTIKIAFYCQSLWSGGDNDLHIDNIAVTEGNAQSADSLTVVVTVNDATMGTTSPAPGVHHYAYNVNDTIVFSAIPNNGYSLYFWRLTYFDTIVRDLENLSFSIVSSAWASVDTLFVDAFLHVPESLQVNVAVNDPSMGSTTPQPGSYTYQEYDIMSFSATPNNGYNFVEWVATYAYNGIVDTLGYVTTPQFDVWAYPSWTQIDPITFTAIFQSDPCETIVITQSNPYTEGFESGVLGNCWNNVSVVGSSAWSVATGDYSSSTGAHSGSYNAKLTHSATGNSTMLLTPMFDATALTTAQLNFWYVNRSWSGDIDNMAVYYRTSANGQWLLLDSVTDAHASWTEATYNLPNTAVQVAFMMVDRYGYGVAIDDVVIGPAPSCLAVTGLTVSDVTANSVTLSWTDAQNTGATYTVMQEGTTLVSGLTATTYTVTGLNAHTNYTFSVVANCSATDASYPTSVSVTTLPEPISCGNDPASIFANADSATSTTNYFPGYSLYNYSYSEVIVPASRLTGLGEIKGLAFDVAAVAGGSSLFNNCEIYLMHTDSTSLSNGFIQDSSNFQLVFSGDLSHSETGWQTVTFDNSFVYDGSSNLVVAVRRNHGSWASSGSFSSYAADAQLARYVYTDNGAYTIGSITGGTASSNVPLYRLIGCESSSVDTNLISISFAVNNAAMGTIVPAPGTYNYSYGTAFNFTAYPNTGYQFDGWYVTVNLASGAYTYLYENSATLIDTANSFFVNYAPVTLTAAFSEEVICPDSIAIPFFDGFENGADCWTTAHANSNTGIILDDTYAYQDSTSFVFHYSDNPPQYLVTPRLAGTGNGVQVEFYYRVMQVSFPESFQVGYSTTTNDTNAFIWGTELTNLVNTSYVRYSEIFNAAGIKYIAIRYTADDQFYLFIDNFAVTDIPTCMSVTDLTVSAATFNSITLSWSDASNSGATYSVYNMDDNTLVASGITSTTYTVTGLSAATQYTFGVVANCSSVDQSSMVVVTANTACDDISTLPYNEDFEAGLGCWTSVNGSSDGMDWYAFNCTQVGQNAHSGNSVASSWSWNNGAMHANAWLISPKFLLPNTSDSLSLTWWEKTSSSYPDSYSVLLSSTTNDTSAFTTVIRPYAVSAGEWTIQTVDLTAYAGQDIYIAFHHVDYDMNYLFIDDISLYQGTYTPPAPDTLTLTLAVNDATMGTTVPAPGTYQYLSTETVTIHASPYSGYHFVGWEWVIAGDVVDTLGPQYISAALDVNNFIGYGSMTLTALFEPGNADSTTITYAVNDASMGTTVPAPGTYSIYVGNAIEAAAVPNPGYALAAWIYDVYYQGSVAMSDTIPYYSDDFANPIHFGYLSQSWAEYGVALNVTAVFVPDTMVVDRYLTIITGVNSTDMGSITPAPGEHQYYLGDHVHFTATPNEGYHYENAHITVTQYGLTLADTVVYDDLTDLDLDVEEEMLGAVITIVANFAPNGSSDQYVTLYTAVNDPSMGTMTPAPGEHHYYVGETVHFSVSPNEGYRFDNAHVTATMMGIPILDSTVTADLSEFDIEVTQIMLGAVINVTVNFAPVNSIDVAGQLNDIKVYPNPTHGKVTVDADDVVKVDVMDLNGRIVTSFENTNSFDISSLTVGTYMLRIETLSGTTVKRVVKK